MIETKSEQLQTSDHRERSDVRGEKGHQEAFSGFLVEIPEDCGRIQEESFARNLYSDLIFGL